MIDNLPECLYGNGMLNLAGVSLAEHKLQTEEVTARYALKLVAAHHYLWEIFIDQN